MKDLDFKDSGNSQRALDVAVVWQMAYRETSVDVGRQVQKGKIRKQMMRVVTVEVEMKRSEWTQNRIRGRTNRPYYWAGCDEQRKGASKSEA